MGTVGTGLLAACGGTSTSAGQSSTTTLAAPTEPAFLYPAFPIGFGGSESVTVAGIPQRVTFVLRDNVDIMRRTAPESTRISITLDGVEVAGGASSRHDDGIITPYYPVVFTPPAPGEYVATLVDHPDVEAVTFLVRERSEVSVPLVGDQIRPVDTPTFENHRGVEPVCTRAVPCPFHTTNLNDFLDNGRPTVLVIATPGFCQTDICGPVVDLLIDLAPGRPDIDFVHAEVYVDPSVFQTGKFPETTPAVSVNELPFEPVIYLADADGTIMSLLSTTWDRSELAEALTAI